VVSFQELGYLGGMIYPLDLCSKHWHLIISPSYKRLLIAIAYLAGDTSLVVLDCGRRFDSSIVARAARGRQKIIDNIRVQRAFTCYEAVKLLEQNLPVNTPIIILDFLSTFCDENVRLNLRKFLLERSLHHFQRLSRQAGLSVSVDASGMPVDSIPLFERLCAAAPSVSNYGALENENLQPGLF